MKVGSSLPCRLQFPRQRLPRRPRQHRAVPGRLGQEHGWCSMSRVPPTACWKPCRSPGPSWSGVIGAGMAPSCCLPDSWHLKGKSFPPPKALLPAPGGCGWCEISPCLFLAGFCRWSRRKHSESCEPWTRFWLSLEARKWSKGKLGVLDRSVWLTVTTQRVQHLLDTKRKFAVRILLFWKVLTKCQGGKWGFMCDGDPHSRAGEEDESGTASFDWKICFLVNNFLTVFSVIQAFALFLLSQWVWNSHSFAQKNPVRSWAVPYTWC